MARDTLRRCTLADLKAVARGARERAAFGDVIFAVPPPFPAWAWESNGTVLGCGGAFIAEDRAECWLWLSDAARDRPFTLVRFARAFTDMMTTLFPGKTLALWVPVDDAGAARFAAALGFVPTETFRAVATARAQRWDRPQQGREAA